MLPELAPQLSSLPLSACKSYSLRWQASFMWQGTQYLILPELHSSECPCWRESSLIFTLAFQSKISERNIIGSLWVRQRCASNKRSFHINSEEKDRLQEELGLGVRGKTDKQQIPTVRRDAAFIQESRGELALVTWGTPGGGLKRPEEHALLNTSGRDKADCIIFKEESAWGQGRQ